MTYNTIHSLSFIKRGVVMMAACMSSLLVCAQSLSEQQASILKYVQNAMNYNRTAPQEKVYMHFDNTGYFENETVWFKAYVNRSCPLVKVGNEVTDRIPTNLSKVIYVELLNPSGDVLKTTKWPIDSLGQANGDLKLDTLYGTGFYEIRAYTRYMTNWGVNACFSRVFPVFSAPKVKNDYHDLRIDTYLRESRNPNNRDHTDSIYLKAINEGVYTSNLMKTVSVQFYPEGGDMVKGKKGRVAVLVVDDNGRPFSASGFVQNNKGDVLATVETDTLGRGVFELTPDGTPLTFQIRNLKDKTQTFPLPQPKDEGVALMLDAVNDDMLVTLRCSDAMCGKLLGFCTVSNGNVTYCDTIIAEPVLEIELDRNRQREGVNQFTVFDSNGQILAERLYFITPKISTSDSIFITPVTKRLKPCGEVVLDVKSQPNSTFSFSAIDAVNMTNGKQGNIKTWMLLSSEVRGYIHNVGYYFESDDKPHRQSADLLMLTQGWRRYDWELMEGRKVLDNVQHIEDKFYMYGKLNEYRKKNPANNVTMEAYLYNEKGESLKGETVTDDKGNYAFELPFMDGEWEMQIFTKINDKRKTFYVGIDRHFSPVPRFITPAEACIMPPLGANSFVRKADEEVPEEEVFVPITERNHLLENVTVKANRRYFTNDDWKFKNEGYGSQFAQVFYDIDKERDAILDSGKPEMTIFEFLCKKNAMFQNQECHDLPEPPRDAKDTMWRGWMAYGGRPIKWIVDNGERQIKLQEDDSIGYAVKRVLGIEPSGSEHNHGEMYGLITSRVGATGDDLFPLWMSDYKHLYIVPNSNREMDGAVRIYLYSHTKFTTMSQKGLRRTYFQGFNKPSTFQMEDYSVLPPMADFRRTVYWEPTVRTDAQGKAQVRFYNNSTAETLYLSAEGVNQLGHPLTNE